MTSVLCVRWLVAAALLVLVSSAVAAADAPPRPAGMAETVKAFLQDPDLPAGLVADFDGASPRNGYWGIPLHSADPAQDRLEGEILSLAEDGRVRFFAAQAPPEFWAGPNSV